MQTSKIPNDKIGLPAAVFVIVGFVIGASIYVLPGQLYALAGPTLIVSFLIAAIPAALSCLLAAQIGAAFSSDAANIELIRRALAPSWAAITAWCFVGASVVASALLAYGFADYVIALYPDLSKKRTIIALCVLTFFSLVNFFGIKNSARLQAAMVGLLLLALLAFIAKGAGSFSSENLLPFSAPSPNGIILAIIPAFFAFLGFSMVVEISGEIKAPERNVPLALLISLAMISALYLSVVLIVLGVVPGNFLSGAGSAVGLAADIIAPGAFALAIKVSALLAAATSVNALILLSSRDAIAFYRIATGNRDASTAQNRAQEKAAVLFVSGAGAVCIASGFDITTYAVTTVLGFLFAQIIICVAAMYMPKILGAHYENLSFCIPHGLLRIVCWMLIVACIGFIGISLVGNTAPTIATAIFIGIGFAFFKFANDISVQE